MELLFWLLTKHLVVDFFLQGPYQYKNKGTYGHFGGVLHAGLHGLASAVILGFLHLPMSLAILDAVIHYHVDWAKMKTNAFFKWTPVNSEKFWWLLGIDQYLHMLTYLLIWKVTGLSD